MSYGAGAGETSISHFMVRLDLLTKVICSLFVLVYSKVGTHLTENCCRQLHSKISTPDLNGKRLKARVKN